MTAVYICSVNVFYEGPIAASDERLCTCTAAVALAIYTMNISGWHRLCCATKASGALLCLVLKIHNYFNGKVAELCWGGTASQRTVTALLWSDTWSDTLSLYLSAFLLKHLQCKLHSLCTQHGISHSAPQGEEQHLLWLPCSQNLQDWWQLVIWLMNPLCLVGEKFNLNCIWKMWPIQRCKTAISDYYRSS